VAKPLCVFAEWNGERVAVGQGDQIGRIFAHWAIVYFGHVFKKIQKERKYVGNIFPANKFCINIYKILVWLHFV
jgi:hypothetical protein